jgi:hypothetical protein
MRHEDTGSFQKLRDLTFDANDSDSDATFAAYGAGVYSLKRSGATTGVTVRLTPNEGYTSEVVDLTDAFRGEDGPFLVEFRYRHDQWSRVIGVLEPGGDPSVPWKTRDEAQEFLQKRAARSGNPVDSYRIVKA